jgi:hypothetical protein
MCSERPSVRARGNRSFSWASSAKRSSQQWHNTLGSLRSRRVAAARCCRRSLSPLPTTTPQLASLAELQQDMNIKLSVARK